MTAGRYSLEGPRRGGTFAAVLLHVAGVVWLSCANFPTRNEVAHVPAGVTYLCTGEFHLYRVNPPLTRLAQAFPVLLVGFDASLMGAVSDPPGARLEWEIARVFASNNASDYLGLMTLARLPGVAWSLLGLWLVRRWAGELYGPRAAALATVLWCFGPNVLAHASLATPDLPCAVLCLAASYSFHRYLHSPTAAAAFRSGAILGLAQLTKFTALADYLAWLILAVAACRSCSVSEFRRLPVKRRLAHGALLVLSSALVMNLGYGCEGTFTPLGRFDFVSRATSVHRGGETLNRFANTWLGSVPVPLPVNYVRGLDLQQADFESGRPSYLRGEWRREGWWYFYLYALAVKVPVGTLALGVVGLVLSFTPRYRRFDELVVWVPAGVLFAMASAKTGYTMHFRYVLPALPFALVGLSKVAELRNRWWTLAVVLLASSSVASSARVYPHSLAYFNEAAGGPENGDAHLTDSNLDWGQDLTRFKWWFYEYPEARPIHLAYMNYVDYRVAGLPDLPPAPTNVSELTPGYYAVDVYSIHLEGLGYFRSLTPVARIGYTIRVYRLDGAEIARLQASRRPP